MPYNSVADSIHINGLRTRLSSSEMHFFDGKRPFSFLSATLGDLRATYAVLLRLLGMTSPFLLVIIELFY